VVPILFQVVTQVKPQRLGIFAHRLELVPPKAVTLSGREQKENGGSSKGEKYFGCGNCPLIEGLRRPERSEGRRSPSTRGHADAMLNCEKNNWPNG
jgi:hypothetical protein